MNIFNDIIITDIEQPFVVHSAKGRNDQMIDRQSFGISLCISGQITYTINRNKYISNQSCAIILPQGGTYSIHGDKDGLFPVINFKCENFKCNDIVVLPLENSKMCIQNFETIKSLFLDNRDRLKIYSLFYELLSNISSSNSNEHTPLDFVIKYIADNLHSPELSNSMLARKIGISEVYLRKLFATHYKISPKQYILNLRIHKAKQMLCDTSITVAAIAEECGFSSVYHFCRTFKQHTGLTPMQYAANNKVYKI